MAQVLGIGCDVLSVARIARIAQRSPQLFAERILGDVERREFAGSSDWVRCACHVAAKEALFKALGTGLIGAMRWTDVQVINAQGRPRLALSGATRVLLEEIGECDILFTVFSDKQHALAKVALVRGADLETETVQSAMTGNDGAATIWQSFFDTTACSGFIFLQDMAAH